MPKTALPPALDDPPVHRRRPLLSHGDHTGRLARMRSTFAAAPLILALVFHTVAALGASSLLSKSTPRRLGEFILC